MQWFSVDKVGLGKLLEGRGPAFIGRELVQNALDENTSRCTVKITWEDGVTTLRVEDDSPEGFHDLSHAWTLFAESKKKGDPTKRGRFNLGEKLVLALCHYATITTTTGRVIFDKNGRRRTASKTAVGSVFEGKMKQTKRNCQELREGVLSIIPPENILLTVDGEVVHRPEVVKNFDAKSLATEYSGPDGILKRTARNTTITLFAVRDEETAFLHEMGIPVVELEAGDRWHVDVQQKVPLTLDRDNVTPSYMKKIRLLVLNATFDLMTDEEDANASWAREAMSDPDVSTEAVNKILDLRFGKKRVAWDPSDKEANALAISKGYAVIHGRQLSKDEWVNVRAGGTVRPAGQVTPSPQIMTSREGRDVEFLRENWTDEMVWVVEHATRLGRALISHRVEVGIVKDTQGSYIACYGGNRMEFNVWSLGRQWFNDRAAEGPFSIKLNQLIIHELGHHYGSNHLDEKYHDGLCTLGADLALLVHEHPQVFVPMLVGLHGA